MKNSYFEIRLRYDRRKNQYGKVCNCKYPLQFIPEEARVIDVGQILVIARKTDDGGL